MGRPVSEIDSQECMRKVLVSAIVREFSKVPFLQHAWLPVCCTFFGSKRYTKQISLQACHSD